ncbi:hypothetical protein COL47_14100 [Bacillus toyonensis]|nr:hypothetical protein COO13_19850 [Bacillus toyonensis]PEA65275.1 hypothetical protein COO18_18470 [Bacillus toyonensis]PEI64815.1 hypothetical protein CN674_31415 [Bacillus toyonensis]PFY18299.1 hypothetical protein COL47_14100 [Bacillus toyonensis]PGA32568.1 hypothetical protein COL81_27870 [Bacillus toyonensis]
MLRRNHVVYGLVIRYPLVFLPNEIEIFPHRKRLLKGRNLSNFLIGSFFKGKTSNIESCFKSYKVKNFLFYFSLILIRY